MNADQIRELVKTRDDWRHLRRFDRDQPFGGEVSSAGWLTIAYLSQKVTKQQRRAYYAALKLLRMVHSGAPDAPVTNWWKLYKREYGRCGSPALR